MFKTLHQNLDKHYSIEMSNEFAPKGRQGHCAVSLDNFIIILGDGTDVEYFLHVCSGVIICILRSGESMKCLRWNVHPIHLQKQLLR